MAGGRIKNATLVLLEGLLQDGELRFNEGKIEKIFKSPPSVEEPRLELYEPSGNVVGDQYSDEHRGTLENCLEWDLQGDYLIPGLIDTHVHGAGGFDVMDGTPEAIRSVQAALLEQGTTAFLGTTMSASKDFIMQAIHNAAQIRSENTRIVKGNVLAGQVNSPAGGAEILGVHMEGPFLSQEYKGAQATDGIWADDGMASEDFLLGIFKEYPGLVRILTLAPERADARELIACCSGQGVIPSAGHSAASYERMLEAVSWGLKRVTHAFNAKPGIHHRKPGLLAAALADNRVSLELIADGVHIHPSVLEIVLRLKPENGVCLVSDGSRSVGMADGEYELGGQQTFVHQGVARLADGTIAGSAFPLLQGVKTLVRAAHFPLHLAVKAASLIPARILGADERLGSLEVNKEATFVRLTRELNVAQVWRKGVLVVDK
ncbi:N-acetylglucosamine 6-phosphate deacetylase [Desulfosporosinus acidiphilus SJ4]|uniref:N-acetylglucosamine 6-phosphate deacetylase n=1 Tax=Desulfosporosinus acidiphilus (strain DSM 22704 / JCM 16185 / SJ4) TaxID=646529 RepID=I4D9M4_DESAJ|nr:N-acetylglucosamine-6-phosphate deacetylase [Desulfosporosinus acidiphilus]AFM42498.1 N-acetylglucosamine 6-phosphate deacetylase [Desulfosporosinus acidiphilus SJ4]